MTDQVVAIKLDNYSKARAQMLLKFPFFASVVLATEFLEDEKIPTACTNYIKVWYNPKFLNSLSLDVCTFVIIHEIMHIILKHNLRMGMRKPIRWNKACDYAINNELKDAGVKLWEHCLVDARFHGMTAEQIYDILTQEKENGGKSGRRGKPGKPGQGQGSPDDDDDIKDLGPMGQDMRPGDSGDLSPAEKAAASNEIDGRVSQAATIARAAGNMPNSLSILVDGIINPPQPWEMLLQEFMTRLVRSEESWSRRNRRFSVVLPSRRSYGMGELVIIGDTSASMLEHKIWNQLAAEINHCNEFVAPERTRVVWADYAECSGEQIFEEGEPIELKPVGGGGTDMRLPLHFVEQYDPCCVILVTDTETPWPDAPTPYPLIVCSTTKGSGPEWAVTIHLR